MFCSNCGTQVPDQARFCKHCGAALPLPAAAPQQSPVTAYVPVAEQPATPYTPAPQQPVAPYAPAPQQPVVPYTPAPQQPSFTPYTPVSAPEPVVTAPAAAPEVTAPPAKKKKKKLLPILCILILVVAAAAVAAVYFLGRQPMYLVTKTVNHNANGPVITTTYEYDDAGRITNYTYAMEYPEALDIAGTHYEISYEYNKKGKPASAEFTFGDESFEVEYIYEKNVLTGFELDGNEAADGLKLKVKCDDDGRFKYIGFLDEDGLEHFVWEFKYHDNGTVKETRQFRLRPSSFEAVTRFNENGKTTEISQYYDGVLQYRIEQDYDEAGRQTLMKQYNSQGEVYVQWETEYTTKKDRITGMVMRIQAPAAGGETMDVTVTFACAWDGNACELTIDKIEGPEEALDAIGLGAEDLKIYFETNKSGDMLEIEVKNGKELVFRTTYEYKPYTLPKNYKKVNIQTDPLYLQFLMNLQ